VRAIRREVDAAFLLRVLFPPPAAGAFVLAFTDGPRARRAADAGVALRVQRMHRNLVLNRVGFHLLRAPIRDRRQLEPAGVLRHLWHRRARPALPPPQTGRPSVELAKLALERADLAYIAAQLPQLGAVAKQVEPM